MWLGLSALSLVELVDFLFELYGLFTIKGKQKHHRILKKQAAKQGNNGEKTGNENQNGNYNQSYVNGRDAFESYLEIVNSKIQISALWQLIKLQCFVLNSLKL